MRYYILHTNGSKEVIWTRNKEYDCIEDIPERAQQSVSFPSADRCYKLLSSYLGSRVSAKTAKKKGFRLVSQSGVPTKRKSGELQKVVPKHLSGESKSPDTENRKLQFLKEINRPSIEVEQDSKKEIKQNAIQTEGVKPIKSNIFVKVENSPFGIETADKILNINIENVKQELKSLINLVDSKAMLARDEDYLNGLQEDRLHAIEFGNFNVVDGYKQAKSLQELRHIRRQVKNIRRLAKCCTQFQEELQVIVNQIQNIQNQVYMPRSNPDLFENIQEEQQQII